MIEELHSFFEKGDINNLLAFLKKLTLEERKIIIPELELRRRDEYKWNFENCPAISRKIEMLEICYFVCLDKSHIRNLPRYDLPEDEVIDNILKWYQPEWFSEYFNRVKTLPYKYLMRWKNAGYLTPEKGLIAKSLSSALWVKIPDKMKGYYSIDVLEEFPETLNEHIWYLFEYESDIVFYDEYSGVDNPENEHIWINAFQRYADNGIISRPTLFKQCLSAISKRVNPKSSTWYATLFASLKPSTHEILSFRDELLGLFTGGFVQKELLEILCNEIAALFLCKDESVKQQVASIFSRFGNQDSYRIREALSLYSGSIPMSIKPLLLIWL
ncbi:MAG: DUF6493 family protein [Tannerellaceae bacterium]|jgi:hypothetical protein|nr:DUF6493 family protein [Tannerellaceae bacterium]